MRAAIGPCRVAAGRDWKYSCASPVREMPRYWPCSAAFQPLMATTCWKWLNHDGQLSVRVPANLSGMTGLRMMRGAAPAGAAG